jgi:hypothetical protein
MDTEGKRKVREKRKIKTTIERRWEKCIGKKKKQGKKEKGNCRRKKETANGRKDKK